MSQSTTEEKFRVSLSVSEMELIVAHLSMDGGALDNLALIQKFHKTIAKAQLGITVAAYAGSTKVPGMGTIAKIQQSEADAKGAALLSKLHAGESLSDDETYDAMTYLIDVRKEAPTHPAEIAAMDTYMTMKIQKSIGG